MAIVYTIVILVRPLISPLAAGGVAIAYRWFIEFAQLTLVPAALSDPVPARRGSRRD